jgi:inner membrane protein
VYRFGHYGVALLFYAPIGLLARRFEFTGLAAWGIVLTMVAARLPDKDHDIPFISHRGITHTVWFALGVAGVTVAVIFFASNALGAGKPGLSFGVFSGACVFSSLCSHLVADSLTPAGISPFSPLSGYSISLDMFSASNRYANFGLFLIGFVSLTISLLYPI